MIDILYKLLFGYGNFLGQFTVNNMYLNETSDSEYLGYKVLFFVPPGGTLYQSFTV